MNFCFAVHKLDLFLSNPGKLHFEGLGHLLRYIRDKKNLIMRYYSKIEDAPLSDPLIQARIKTWNQLMAFYYSIWKDCIDTGRSTWENVFYQSGPIDHWTHVPGPVAQYSSEGEYNTSCTTGMYLAHYRMLHNNFLNKGPHMDPC